jgi:hypothetical protein
VIHEARDRWFGGCLTAEGISRSVNVIPSLCPTTTTGPPPCRAEPSMAVQLVAYLHKTQTLRQAGVRILSEVGRLAVTKGKDL